MAITSRHALAHKLKVFATVQDGKISGYTYFAGGGKPKNATIIIKNRNDKILGKVKTDPEGRFSYTPQYQTDHLITMESKDGHTAKWLIKKEDLAELKQFFSKRQDDSNLSREDLRPNSISKIRDPFQETDNYSSLARKVDLLREELGIFQERIFLRDILGGIGYLLGLTGILCYWLGLKKRRESTSRLEAVIKK